MMFWSKIERNKYFWNARLRDSKLSSSDTSNKIEII